jgi:hypothetical protein
LTRKRWEKLGGLSTPYGKKGHGLIAQRRKEELQEFSLCRQYTSNMQGMMQEVWVEPSFTKASFWC